MTDSLAPVLEAWRLDVDDRDELLVRGAIDGVETWGVPVGFDGDTVRLRDGRDLRLGAPHPDVGHAPHHLPPAAFNRRRQRLAVDLERIRAGHPPTAEELAAAPELTGWTIQGRTDSPYLTGYVTAHPRLPDNAWITTSPLVWLAPDLTCGRTASRWYRLRNPFVPMPIDPP